MNTARSDDELFSPQRFPLLLGLALAAIYFPVLLGGQTFYYRDFGVLATPTAYFHKMSILGGQFPFWNPYSNCGAPFLAQWGTMVLYPLSLIYVLLPMPWSLNFFCLVHLWIGGVGMYFVARKWTGATWPAVLAGTAFTFNGITLAALAWPNYVAAIGLFPWVLLTVERAFSPLLLAEAQQGRTGSGRVISAALVSAMQLLTGVPELCVLTWLLVTALWIVRIVQQPASLKRLFLVYSAIVIATAGLVCVQLLPFYELLQNSHRAPGFASEKWSLSFAGLGNLVLPRFRTLVTPEGTAFQYDQWFLTSTYIGAPLLVLSFLAWRTRDARARLLCAVSILSVVLALGSKGLLLSLLTSLFPSLNIARFPVKFVFVLAFAVPLLAAFGAQYLDQLPSDKRRKLLLLAAGATTAVFVGLLAFNHARPLQYDILHELRANSLTRWTVAVVMLSALYYVPKRIRSISAGAALFLLLLVVDAKTHLYLNPTIRASIFSGNAWNEAHKVEKPSLGNGRIFITKEAEDRLYRSDIADPAKDLLGKRMAEWSHLNLLDAIPKVNGSSTLQIREQALLQNSLYSTTNQQLEAWLDFLGVRYQTSSNSIVEWQARTNYAPFVSAGQGAIFEARNPLEKPIDFKTEATVHSLVNDPPRILPTDVQITNVTVQLNEVRFDAHSSNQTIAVIGQSWYPAWKVEFDGEQKILPTPVLRANLAFQAILLPPGRTSVRVFYDDHSFKMGAAISGATLLLCAFFWVREKKNALPE